MSRRPGHAPVLHPYLAGPYPRAYAHRGWHLDELAGLENTTAAFRRAVDEGYSYLELDVHATADGVAVVHHDRTLDRTTDASGPLAARTAAELDPGAGPRPAPAASRSRTCDEVLAALPDTRVTVELKSGAAVRPVLDVLARLDAWDRVCLAGYHDPWLRVARRLAAAGGAPLFTSMGHTAVVGLRLRGWTRRDDGRPAARPRRRPPRPGPRRGSRRCAATWPSSPTGSPG